VVADEVRKLAEHTANAIKEIEGAIADMQMETKTVAAMMEESIGEVELGTTTIGRARQVLRDIMSQITAVNHQIGQIAVSAEQEKMTTTEISANIQRVSSVMERISGEMQDSSQAVLQLSNGAEGLEGMLRQFKI
jgi:methyl-accepting chemotaxis protein